MSQQSSLSDFLKTEIYQFDTKQDSQKNPVFLFNTYQNSTIEVIIHHDNTTSSFPCNSILVTNNHYEAKSKKKDLKVMDTISHIVFNYMLTKPNELFYYVSDTSDGRHEARFRLFRCAYNKIYRFNDDIKQLTYSLPYEDDCLYLGVFFNSIYFEHKDILEELISITGKEIEQ